jgi:hypothetical protein
MAIAARKQTRELMDFLRTEYGAEGLRLERGGKHNKLKFRCRGSEYSYVVGAPSDARAIKNIHAELKRMLGLPASRKEKGYRGFPSEAAYQEHYSDIRNYADELPAMAAYSNQEEYIEELVADMASTPHISTPSLPELVSPDPSYQAARTWEVKVAAYTGQSSKGPVVWFIFPKQASDYIKETYRRVAVERLDEEHWQITNGGSRKFNAYDGDKLKLTYSDADISPFGSSPAEAVEANGEILIFLPTGNRIPIATMSNFHSKPQPQPQPKPVPPIRLKSDPVQPDPTPPPVQQAKVTIQQPMLMTSSTLMEQRMRDLIRQIYDIEDLCPYRLVRLSDGRLSWRAPEIA